MTRNSKNRIALTSLFVMSLLVLSTSSFAALNAYLKLKPSKGTKGEATYQCKLDESGKFSFHDVAPGQYDLVLEVTATDQAGNTGSDSKTMPSSIEISSFSWGTSNSGSLSTSAVQGKSTQVTRSNISNNKSATWTVDSQPPDVTCDGVRVATGDVNGDGVPDMITSAVTVKGWDPEKKEGISSKVVIHDITIMSVSSPEGACKASWDLKKNVK
jgi:hypothetical protein